MFKRTRKEAIAAGDLFYLTGKPCRNGHISKRYSGGMCYECLRNHRAANREKELERVGKHHRKHPEKSKSRSLKWRSANRHKTCASSGKRRAAKLNATPSWLTQAQLAEAESKYALAQQLTVERGEKYQVDHIVPLQGERVSGLHVPWNLQVIPAIENIRKSNSYVYV